MPDKRIFLQFGEIFNLKPHLSLQPCQQPQKLEQTHVTQPNAGISSKPGSVRRFFLFNFI